MFQRLFVLLTFIGFFTTTVSSQRLKKADKQTLANLKAHIGYLADDKLEGRRAGTAGETLASTYISQQFEKIGLEPQGSQGWLQAFDINDGKQVNPATYLLVNSTELIQGKDYFPLAFSANKSTEAAVSPALAEKGVPWFLDLKDLLEENKTNPHFDLGETIRTKALAAAEKGASALILSNSGSIADQLKFDGKDKTEAVSIPILYITAEGIKKHLASKEATYDVKLKVDLGPKTRTGHNVVGFLNNGASNTVIIGAHFDHLGYGEDGNSMLRTGEKLIHNGADDNASGSSAMMELARILKKSGPKSSNYLFLAFSAEELGLNGSKYFTDHPTLDLASANYMINMDMVGRLNDSTKVLTVGGYGTSPWWSQLFQDISKKNKYFVLKYDSSGTGPSDHTSFYRKDIPVLFMFTGLHSDYHRPSDDADRINYTGEVQIINLVFDVVKRSANQQKLAFTKTKETQTTTSARFSVSMGIMPDYTYAGTGVHVDGVSEGKPAQKAGLLKDDVILQLGPHPTASVEAYMQALGKFKKGDKATVKFKRGGKDMELEVQF